MLQHLVSSGVDINRRYDSYRDHLLYIAINRNDHGIFSYLLGMNIKYKDVLFYQRSLASFIIDYPYFNSIKNLEMQAEKSIKFLKILKENNGLIDVESATLLCKKIDIYKKYRYDILEYLLKSGLSPSSCPKLAASLRKEFNSQNYDRDLKKLVKTYWKKYNMDF